MDSDSFFGFDASLPLDEEELDEDDAYNALNDETFGSAAVGGDWEENHKQLSSLTEAERLRRAIGKDVEDSSRRRDYRLEELHNNEDLRRTLDSLSLEKKRLFERSLGPSPLIDLQKDELSTSPGNSIWSPTIGLGGLESLRQLNVCSPSQCQFNSFNTQPPLNTPHQQYGSNNAQSVLSDFNLGLSGNNISASVKTVSELEEELKCHSNQQGQKFPTTLSQPFQSTPENYPSGSPAFHHNNANLKQHLGNVQQYPLQYHHPLLNTMPNKVMPPGFMNNMQNMQNRPMGFNPQMNQRGPLNRPFFHGGNNPPPPLRNNINRSMGDKRNFDQNFRHDQARNMHDHLRDKGPNNGTGGNRIRRDSDAEWEEWQRIRQSDGYSGLMTPREKQWLRNIQAMQLQTDNPYQDDYYYVMHNVRQQWKREEEVIEIDGLQFLLSDKLKEGKEYEPPRLENSLGKLQVASVNAPRKIIDLQVVHLDSSHPTTTLQRDMRKHRHLLLHIEKLYNTQIELDDLERKIRALPDCPTRDLFRSKCRQLVSKLWTGLAHPHESFVQLLCIKKGKTLAARLLSWVTQTEVEHLLATVIQNLSLLSKKDIHDKRLPLLWPFADRFFAVCPLPSLLSFSIMVGAQLKEHKNRFIPALSNRLGLSMVLSLLVRGEEMWSELEDDEAWSQFLRDVVTGLESLSGGKGGGKGSSDTSTSNIQPLPSVTLAASPRPPSNHLLKCKDVSPASLSRAVDVLKKFEAYLVKSTPVGSTVAATGGGGHSEHQKLQHHHLQQQQHQHSQQHSQQQLQHQHSHQQQQLHNQHQQQQHSQHQQLHQQPQHSHQHQQPQQPQHSLHQHHPNQHSQHSQHPHPHQQPPRSLQPSSSPETKPSCGVNAKSSKTSIKIFS